MTDPQHQSKRRRLDAAATLSRPFKSPLRRPSSTASSQPAAPSTPETGQSSKIESIAISNTPKFNPNSQSSSEVARSVPRAHKPVSTSLATPARSPLSDPEVLELQKKQRSLQSRLTTLRSELDTARQALRIESSTQDAELTALVHKWRLISQDVGDEVFTSARERVSRMGGMTAWRERTKRETASWGSQDDANPWSENDGHLNRNLDDEDERNSRSADLENRKDGSSAEEGEQHDEFTMEFMLKTLNIEPKTIGFDTVGQRWVKD